MEANGLPVSSPSPFGDPLPCGRIVRFQYPDTNFDQACAGGPEHETEHFSEIMAGLRVGHADALRHSGSSTASGIGSR